MLLGDAVEKIIEKTVPKKVIDAVKKKEGGCGCNKRKQALNDFNLGLSRRAGLLKKRLTR